MRPSGVIALSGACALLGGACAAEARGPAPEQQVLDRRGVNVDALRGIVVWEAPRGGRAALVRLREGRVRAIPGAREGRWTDDLLSSGNFGALDLGLDESNRVVATYRRCGARRCRLQVIDVLTGRRKRIALAVPRRCEVRGGAAMWGRRIATTLSCAGRGRSGVYLLMQRRARLVKKLSAKAARSGTAVDLVGNRVVGVSGHQVWVASGRCHAAVTRFPSYADLERVRLADGQVWWGQSTASDFGGSEWEFGEASIGPGCSLGPRRALPGLPELDWASGSFAVDGGSVYVAGRESGGVVRAPVP